MFNWTLSCQFKYCNFTLFLNGEVKMNFLTRDLRPSVKNVFEFGLITDIFHENNYKRNLVYMYQAYTFYMKHIYTSRENSKFSHWNIYSYLLKGSDPCITICNIYNQNLIFSQLNAIILIIVIFKTIAAAAAGPNQDNVKSVK